MMVEKRLTSSLASTLEEEEMTTREEEPSISSMIDRATREESKVDRWKTSIPGDRRGKGTSLSRWMTRGIRVSISSMHRRRRTGLVRIIGR